MSDDIENCQKPDGRFDIGSCGHFCEACARRDDKIESLTTQLAEKTAEVERMRGIIPDERILELADRLVSSGPKCAYVSASETHELRDYIFEVFEALNES